MAECLLAPAATAGEQRAAAHALHALMLELAGLSEADLLDRPARVAGGLALGTRSAARCILDYVRTARFLLGVRRAIEQLGAGSRRPVQVLYAGCGPFAPLALPLTALLPEGAARFTLIDAHPAAAPVLSKLIQALGAEDWITAVVTTDGSQFQPASPPDLLIVETMQKALANEPQVALMQALLPGLAAGGLCVPERIDLIASLASLPHEFGPERDRHRRVLGTILTLEAARMQRGEAPQLGPLTLGVPDDLPASRELLVLTHVRVFGDLALGDYDSGISYPTVACDLGRLVAGAQVEFRYELAPDPHLTWTRLD